MPSDREIEAAARAMLAAAGQPDNEWASLEAWREYAKVALSAAATARPDLFEAFCAGFESTAPHWNGDLFDPVATDSAQQAQLRVAFDEWRASLGEGEGGR